MVPLVVAMVPLLLLRIGNVLPKNGCVHNCLAEGRNVGFRRKHCPRKSRNAGGTVSFITGVIFESSATRIINCMKLLKLCSFHGGDPVTICKAVAPRLQISAFKPSTVLGSNIASGAINKGVPQVVLIPVDWSSLFCESFSFRNFSDVPKSANLICPPSVTNILAPLISRCQMRWSCKYTKPSKA